MSPNSASAWSALQRLFRLMPHPRRRQFYRLLGLMLSGAFAELFAIGAVIPFMAILASPERVSSIPLVQDVLRVFGSVSSQNMLAIAAVGFITTAIFVGLIRIQLARTSNAFVFCFGHDISVEVQRRVLSQPYPYHASHNTSEIIASLEKTQVLIFNVLLQLMQATIAATMSLFIIVVLVAIDPLAASISAITFGAIYGGTSLLTRRRLKRNSRLINESYVKRVQIVQESLGGIRDIIIDNSRSIFLEEFREVDGRLSNARASVAFIGVAPRFVIEAAAMVLIAAVALLVSGREGGISAALPILGALAVGAQRLLPLVQVVYQGWTMAAGNWPALVDISGLLSLPTCGESDMTEAEPLLFQSTLQLDHLVFRHPGREQPTLDDITLTIRQGARVAFIGQTGSGKSTLADLIMGLLEPESGRITIDGVALTESSRSRWWRTIAHVPQAIFLADSTVARNIAFGCPEAQIDMTRVQEAARRAQLHDFIERLPEGYQTPVGERGIRISGGQRQRLGIARALYKRAPVLVLDEATSALDDETERAVMASLQSISDQQLTIIMIAHRLSTIKACDLVVRLADGRITKCGNYEEVMRLDESNSINRQLFPAMTEEQQD